TAASGFISTGATPRSISADYTPTPNKSVAAICVSFNGTGAPATITPPAIRIKRRTGGASGAPTSLANAELAYNETSGVLYIGTGDNGSGVATSIVAIGGAGGAPIDSPTFTGDPKAPTPTAGDADTSIATTAFVTAADDAVKSQLIGSASSGMDTLGEVENY